MFQYLILLSILQTFIGIHGELLEPSNRARYDNYRIYQLELATRKHVELLQQLEQQSDSCSFMGHARHAGQKLIILVAAHKVAHITDLLLTYQIKYNILSYNFQEQIDRNYAEVLPMNVSLAQFDWQHYFHLETINAWLTDLSIKHSNIATLLDLGSSTEGLSLKALKLSHNKSNTAIFIESGIHAREWIAPATATYIIQQLIYSSDERVQQLAKAYNWIILPIQNPDGYKYSFVGDRMWRKNRQLYGLCRGVDLNRNFPFHWNTTESSGDPCRYDFAGPSAASEVETQRLMTFLQNHVEKEQIRTFLSLHSYSQMLMFPYGYTRQRVQHYEQLSDIGRKAVQRIQQLTGRIYASGSIGETIYPSSGGSKDWAYGEMHIPVTFTFELRGPPDSADMFILPADQIEPTARECFEAILTIIEEGKKHGFYD